MGENVPKQDEKPAENADNKNVSKPSGTKQALLALVLLCGLVIGSASGAVAAASLMLKEKAPVKVETELDTETENPCEYALEEPLIVNVYQTQQRRYLSVKPVFVLKNEEIMKKVTEKEVEVQHLLISILKRKTLEQLDDPEAANSIGREIQEMLNLKLELGGAVTNVYFTEFFVQ